MFEFTKKLAVFFTVLAVSASAPMRALAADTPAKIPSDTLFLGKSGSTANKSYVFDFGLGASNPSLFSDNATKALNYSKNIFNVGDGLSSTKQLVANTGAGASNPKIQFNPSTSSWEFANDGVNFTAIGSGSGGAAVEMLSNQGFESGVSQGWSNTGGTFSAVTGGSNLLVGRGSASFTASASGQFFQSSLYTIPNGLVGGNCAASLLYKGGDGSQSFEVVDGSSNILAGPVVLPAVTVATTVPLTFPCPASGTMADKVISSSAGALYAYDQMHLGSSDLINISQARLVGTISFSGCSGGGWTTSSTTLATFPVSTGCSYVATGAFSAPATQIPGFSVASLPAGEYVVQLEGTGVGAGSSGASSFFQFTDGTVTAREVSEIGTGDSMNASGFSQSMFYATAQSNLTIQIFGKSNTGSAEVFSPSTIRMYYYPNSSQLATTADATPQSWSGYQNNSGGWATSSSTFADPSAGTGVVLTQTTNRNFGTVVNEGTGLSAITWTPARSGFWHVCANVQLTNGTNSSVSARIVDGSGTIVDPGRGTLVDASLSSGGSVSLCGDYNVASSGTPVTTKVQIATSAGSALISNWSAAGSAAIQWTISNADQGVAVPYTVGAVVTPSSGVQNIVTVNFAGSTNATACSTSPCIIYGGVGASTVIRLGTGAYEVHFPAGTFSSTPICVCSANAQFGGSCEPDSQNASSLLQQVNTSVGDAGGFVQCIGLH